MHSRVFSRDQLEISKSNLEFNNYKYYIKKYSNFHSDRRFTATSILRQLKKYIILKLNSQDKRLKIKVFKNIFYLESFWNISISYGVTYVKTSRLFLFGEKILTRHIWYPSLFNWTEGWWNNEIFLYYNMTNSSDSYIPLNCIVSERIDFLRCKLPKIFTLMTPL